MATAARPEHSWSVRLSQIPLVHAEALVDQASADSARQSAGGQAAKQSDAGGEGAGQRADDQTYSGAGPGVTPARPGGS